MKKILAMLVLAISLLICSLPSVVFAEAPLLVDIKNMILDTDGWSVLNEGNTTFKDGVLINDKKGDATELFGYTKEKYTDAIFDFDIKMDFKNETRWNGFLVRAQNPLNMPWTENNNYLIVITQSQIELQRFGVKHNFLAVTPTPFKNGERVNIRYGAVNEEKGVHLFLAINGKTIIDVYDTEDAAIREGGYFGVFNNGSVLEFYPSSRVGEKDTPAANTTSISTNGMLGDTINIDYVYSDIHGTTEGETEYVWYRTLANVDHYGKSMALTDEIREKYLEKIEGAAERTYTITDSDVGFNIKCGIKAKSKETGLTGEEIFTDSVYVSTVENMLGNGLFFVKGSGFAVYNGEKIELSKAEIPFAQYGKFYVPAEVCAKLLGYNTIINNNGVEFSKDGKSITVSGKNNVKISNGIVFISLNKLSEISGVSAKYDACYETGMLNDLCAHLNNVEYRKLLKNLRAEIVK